MDDIEDKVSDLNHKRSYSILRKYFSNYPEKRTKPIFPSKTNFFTLSFKKKKKLEQLYTKFFFKNFQYRFIIFSFIFYSLLIILHVIDVIYLPDRIKIGYLMFTFFQLFFILCITFVLCVIKKFFEKLYCKIYMYVGLFYELLALGSSLIMFLGFCFFEESDYRIFSLEKTLLFVTFIVYRPRLKTIYFFVLIFNFLVLVHATYDYIRGRFNNIDQDTYILHFFNVAYDIFFNGFIIVFVRYIEKLDRDKFYFFELEKRNRKVLVDENMKNIWLMDNFFPKFFITRFNEKREKFFDFENVICFVVCIQNLHDYFKRNSYFIYGLVDGFYCLFDSLCDKYNFEKVRLVHDQFICMSNPFTKDLKIKAVGACEMGLELLKKKNEVESSCIFTFFDKFELKCGICCEKGYCMLLNDSNIEIFGNCRKEINHFIDKGNVNAINCGKKVFVLVDDSFVVEPVGDSLGKLFEVVKMKGSEYSIIKTEEINIKVKKIERSISNIYEKKEKVTRVSVLKYLFQIPPGKYLSFLSSKISINLRVFKVVFLYSLLNEFAMLAFVFYYFDESISGKTIDICVLVGCLALQLFFYLFCFVKKKWINYWYLLFIYFTQLTISVASFYTLLLFSFRFYKLFEFFLFSWVFMLISIVPILHFYIKLLIMLIVLTLYLIFTSFYHDEILSGGTKYFNSKKLHFSAINYFCLCFFHLIGSILFEQIFVGVRNLKIKLKTLEEKTKEILMKNKKLLSSIIPLVLLDKFLVTRMQYEYFDSGSACFIEIGTNMFMKDKVSVKSIEKIDSFFKLVSSQRENPSKILRIKSNSGKYLYFCCTDNHTYELFAFVVACFRKFSEMNLYMDFELRCGFHSQTQNSIHCGFLGKKLHFCVFGKCTKIAQILTKNAEFSRILVSQIAKDLLQFSEFKRNFSKKGNILKYGENITTFLYNWNFNIEKDSVDDYIVNKNK